jgi:hypothetical protein
MGSNDPYLGDKNIRSAAGFQLVTSLFLGTMGGWAVVTWFEIGISPGLGAVIGGVFMFIVANGLLFRYGGRSTR